jgi:Meiotically up-regulated gene 113
MGFVYAIRQGSEDKFKFGHTIKLEQRPKGLQTGNPERLTVFDRIETDDYRKGETFIHHLLDSRRGINEFFSVTADEARQAMQACRVFLELELPKRKKVEELSALESGPEMLPYSEDAWTMSRELLRLHQEKDRILIEIARMETAIQLAIGTAKGIEGVATWETGDSRRAFNPEALKAANPELYDLYLTAFDRTRFEMEHRDEYQSYLEARRVRHFRLMHDS